MTLRELLRECDYSATLVLYGADADAAESLRRGRRPESGVLPLYRGAIGYAILDDALAEYIDRRVLRFTAGFARGVPELVVYQRLIQTREEISREAASAPVRAVNLAEGELAQANPAPCLACREASKRTRAEYVRCGTGRRPRVPHEHVKFVGVPGRGEAPAGEEVISTDGRQDLSGEPGAAEAV